MTLSLPNMIPPAITFGFTREEAQLRSLAILRRQWRVDGANNFYVTGDYTGTATFDGLSVVNSGTSGSDIFRRQV